MKPLGDARKRQAVSLSIVARLFATLSLATAARSASEGDGEVAGISKRVRFVTSDDRSKAAWSRREAGPNNALNRTRASSVALKHHRPCAPVNAGVRCHCIAEDNGK